MPKVNQAISPITPYDIFIKPYQEGYKNLSKLFSSNISLSNKGPLSLKTRIICLVKGLVYCVPIINSITYIAIRFLCSDKKTSPVEQLEQLLINKNKPFKKFEIINGKFYRIYNTSPPFELIHENLYQKQIEEGSLKSYAEVIKCAQHCFRKDKIDFSERHRLILNRIQKKLEEAKYQEAIDAQKTPEIRLDFEDIVCFSSYAYNASETIKIIHSTAQFLKNLRGVKILTKMLSTHEVMLKANKEFEQEEDKEAILKRIEKKLLETNYQQAIDAKESPIIILNVEDKFDKSEHSFLPNKCLSFLWNLPGIQIHEQILSYQEVIQQAHLEFANYENKEAIVARIAKRLQEEGYQEALDNGKTPEIVLHWGDTLWAQDNMDEETKKINHAATNFIQKLGLKYTTLK